MGKSPESDRSLFDAHPRDFRTNRYIYPVLSRRAGGISIGVNLNRDKACNFDCVYCQIDRTTPGSSESVDIDLLVDELRQTIDLVVSGRIYETPPFSRAAQSLHRFNDIAICGDGEPTICPNFAEAAAACAEVRQQCCPPEVKLVLITNASLLHRQSVQRGLKILDTANGEIWAKLDAGTEAYYRQIARSNVPFEQILANLREAALLRPIVIQSLFARTGEELPPPGELDSYCERLAGIVAAGGQIKLVQIHTVARPPAESWISPLSNVEVDAVADRVRRRTGLPVAAFYG